MNEIIGNQIFPFLKSKLAMRLSLYIFLIAVVTSLLLGALNGVREYHAQQKALQGEFQQIEKINLDSIKENLWILNINSLQTIFKGLLQKRNFVYFQLRGDKGENLIEVGKRPKENFLLKKIPLYYNDAYGKKVYIGTLTMVATTEFIRNTVIHNTVSTLVILLITMLLVGFSILLLVWLFISKHLFKIQSYTRKIRLDRETAPLNLEREENYWTHNDVLSSLVNAFNNMQQTLQNSYHQLEYQSLHDPLVELPNRRSLKLDISKRIRECVSSEKFAALYFIDLDFFKVLNDSLGHTVGDQVLIRVAKRLKKLQKEGLQIYRIGGDEFLILSRPLSNDKRRAKEAAVKIVKNIQSLFDENITLENRKIKITLSIGIELFQELEDAETIIKHADNALYQAKEAGRNRFAFFHEQMQSNADNRLEMEQRLHQVIENDELITYFQPKFDAKGSVRSAETLVRIKDARGSLVPPGNFIPLAQETGMILELDRQIVRKVFQFIRQNKQKIEMSSIKSIAMNISPNQFLMADFPAFIFSEAKRFGIDPHFIVLEITEEAMISNVEYALETMIKLKKYGFKFSIDDFGTGYSSMRYLINFPLDELKIDKSFIDHILDEGRSTAVIQTIITLAKNLHLNVVAEGVESREQLNAICQYGDVLIQGYVFSRPLPQEEFLHLLEEHSER